MKELTIIKNGEIDLESDSVKNGLIELFSSDDGLQAQVDQVREYVSSFEHNISTGAGRKKTISLASKIASMKVKLDNLGKDLVSGYKEKCKVVDKSRKSMRDQMDEIKEIARKPVTEWEEEQARIAEEKRLQEEAERLAAEIERDHELALLMNADFDRKAEEAEKRAKEEAEAAAERARLAEIKRQEEEAARIAAENAAREASKRHVGDIRRQAKEDLMEIGISEDDAKKIVLQIHAGNIRNVSIKY